MGPLIAQAADILAQVPGIQAVRQSSRAVLGDTPAALLEAVCENEQWERELGASSLTLEARLSFAIVEPLPSDPALVPATRDQVMALARACRAAGSAGAKPSEAALLKAALGGETVTAGASVVYSPALDLPSLSLCFREGHTTHFVSGCVVESLALSLESKGALTLEAKGKFKMALHAGSEETAAGSTTTLIKLAAGGAKLFDVGAYVRVGSDDQAGQGYLISAKDEDADTITLAQACTQAPAAGQLVQGFLPAPSLAGAPVQSHTGLLTLDSAELLITSGTITIANQLKMIEEEVSSDPYPTGFAAGQRSVTGELKCFFRRTYAGLFSRAKSQAAAAVRLSAGESAGHKLRLDLPQAVVDTPEAGGDEYQRELTVNLTGLASGAGENEISVTYK
ncbi:MAG: phage tail tube protein [Azovibrio sp.]|nr:phage tail tube protein [Azovibrio sp.]